MLYTTTRRTIHSVKERDKKSEKITEKEHILSFASNSRGYVWVFLHFFTLSSDMNTGVNLPTLLHKTQTNLYAGFGIKGAIQFHHRNNPKLC